MLLGTETSSDPAGVFRGLFKANQRERFGVWPELLCEAGFSMKSECHSVVVIISVSMLTVLNSVPKGTMMKSVSWPGVRPAWSIR